MTARRDSRINQQDHQALGDLLRAILGNRVPNQQLANLKAILGEKDAVSYGARPGTAVQARRILERLNAFAAWVEEELARWYDVMDSLPRTARPTMTPSVGIVQGQAAAPAEEPGHGERSAFPP